MSRRGRDVRYPRYYTAGALIDLAGRSGQLAHSGLAGGGGGGEPAPPEPPAGLIDAWFASDADVTTDGADIGSVASHSGTRDAAVATGLAPSYVADRAGHGPAIHLATGEWLDLASVLSLDGDFRVHVVCHRDDSVEMTPLASGSGLAHFLYQSANGALTFGRNGVATVGQANELGPHVLTWQRVGSVADGYRNGVSVGSVSFNTGTLDLDAIGAHPSSGRDTDGVAFYAIAAFDASATLAEELDWLATLYPGMWS